MTIASKLTTINTALSDIKTAIVNKGSTPSGNITTYATAISNITPVLENKTITENGIYTPETVTKTSVAIGWWGDSKNHYTGDKTLIGNYIWFDNDNIFSVKVGDTAYNGKMKGNSVVPNFAESLGLVTEAELSQSLDFDIFPGYAFSAAGRPINIDGVNYYKIDISWAKGGTTATIVGNYIWLPSDNYWDIRVIDPIYNSLDSSDSAPDLSAIIGRVVSSRHDILLNFDFVSGYGFRPDTAGTTRYTETTAYDGFGQVTVNVSGGSSGKYQLLDRISDDSNNEIGTVSGFFTDANGVEYAVVCLDAQYRLASAVWCSDNSTIVTDLPIYNTTQWGPWEAKETATFNTQKILDFCSANGYTSSACSHCRSKSFTIDGTTYYGQLPNMVELNDIVRNHTVLNTADTTAGNYSSVDFSIGRTRWSSSQYSSGYAWLVGSSGLVGNDDKSDAFGVVPVLEIPNS